MKRTMITNRFARRCGNAAIGALVGAMFAAFASVVSGSVFAMFAVVFLSIVMGFLVHRCTGALLGLIVGVLLAAFLSMVGGSELGIAAAILIGAFLAALPRPAHHMGPDEKAKACAKSLHVCAVSDSAPRLPHRSTAGLSISRSLPWSLIGGWK